MAPPRTPDGPLGRPAQHALILRWQYLPRKVARTWHARFARGEVEDAAAEGLAGLIYAAGKYDSVWGTAFHTYAYPWVTKSIREYYWRESLGGVYLPRDRWGEAVFGVSRRGDAFWDRVPEREECEDRIPPDFWDRATKDLDARSRTAFLMRHRDGRPLSDVASALRVRKSRAEQITHAAVEQAKEELGKVWLEMKAAAAV